MSNNNNIEFIVKWQGNTFEFQLSENKTVNDLKNCLCEKSGVQPNDQKLIGLGKYVNTHDNLFLLLSFF